MSLEYIYKYKKEYKVMDIMDTDDDVELNVLRCWANISGTTADIKVCNRT